MKIQKLFILIVIVAALFSVVVGKAQSNCPVELNTIQGKCLGSISSESVSGLPDYNQYIENWSADRNLIVYKPNLINPPLILGSNLNKWSLVPEWVYSDERNINGALYVGVKLVCDPNGSKSPTVAISILKSELTWTSIQSIKYFITNYGVIYQPCSY